MPKKLLVIETNPEFQYIRVPMGLPALKANKRLYKLAKQLDKMCIDASFRCEARTGSMLQVRHANILCTLKAFCDWADGCFDGLLCSRCLAYTFGLFSSIQVVPDPLTGILRPASALCRGLISICRRQQYSHRRQTTPPHHHLRRHLPTAAVAVSQTETSRQGWRNCRHNSG